MKISSNLVKIVAKMAVSAGLLALLASKISIDGVAELLRALDIRWAVAAMGVFFLSNLVASLQWHLLLKSSGVELTFNRAFRFYFVGLFFNNFLPANVGGDAVKVYDVTRFGVSVYQVIAVTLLDRLIGIFALCFLAACATLGLMSVAAIDSAAIYLLIFGACMALPMILYSLEPASRLLRRLVGVLRPLALDRRGSDVLNTMGEFKGRRGFVAKLVALSMFIQSLRITTHLLVGLALGIHISGVTAALFFVFVPLLGLAMIPPVTINGLGIREGLGIILFARAGIESTNAFTLEFLTYLVSVLISLVGLFFFLARRQEKIGPTAGDNGI